MMRRAKRRRLSDDTKATLTRPFRSPLRPPLNSPPTKDGGSEAKSDPKAAQRQGPKPPANYGAHNSDPAASATQRANLSLQLTKLRQALVTAQQALDIEASGKNAELQRLTSKWRAVAQAAADELYTDAQTKIKDMGGLKAWQLRFDRNQQDFERQGSPLSAEQETQRAYHTELAATEAEKYGLTDRVDDEGDLTNFTMETMLRQMGVDPNLLKYDKESECWYE